MIHAPKKMTIKWIMLSEINQTQKFTYKFTIVIHDILYGIITKANNRDRK